MTESSICAFCGSDGTTEERSLLGKFDGNAVIGTYQLCQRCVGPMADEDGRGQEHQPDQSPRPPWMQPKRMGGMMPSGGGAQPTDFSQTPSDVESEADYWRGQAEQLEKALQDVGSLHSQHLQTQSFWDRAGGDEQLTLDEMLGRIWDHLLDLVMVLVAVLFVLQLIPDLTLTTTAQWQGAIAVTIFFYKFIRPRLES